MSRHRTAIALALALAALALPAVSASASADPPPRIAMESPSSDPGAPRLAAPVLTVTPDDDLIEDPTVAVHGTGFLADEALLLTVCTPGLDPLSCYGSEVEADAAGVLDTTADVRTFQLQWHGGYDCRRAPFCSVYLLDPVDRAVRASAPLHLRPEGDEAVTVTPTSALPAHATVTVHATGLNEPYRAWVGQCWHDPAFDDLAYAQPAWASCAAERVGFTVRPSRELTTTFRVHRYVTITRSSDGETVAIDCAVDPNCTLTVGGDGVDVLMHNGMDDRGAWIDTPLSFLAHPTSATPAAPIAASPAFTG